MKDIILFQSCHSTLAIMTNKWINKIKSKNKSYKFSQKFNFNEILNIFLLNYENQLRQSNTSRYKSNLVQFQGTFSIIEVLGRFVSYR